MDCTPSSGISSELHVCPGSLVNVIRSTNCICYKDNFKEFSLFLKNEKKLYEKIEKQIAVPHVLLNIPRYDKNKKVDHFMSSSLQEDTDDLEFMERPGHAFDRLDKDGEQSLSYRKRIPVTIRTGDREDFVVQLTCAVGMIQSKRTSQSVRTPFSQSFCGGKADTGSCSVSMATAPEVLRIQLTYENDPLFLYLLDVDETLFQRLKIDQNLLVNFQSFSEKFVQLIHETTCNKRLVAILICGTAYSRFCEAQKHAIQDNYESSGNGAFFNLVESNQFKELTHLSLRFFEGSNNAVKDHLSALLLHYKCLATEKQKTIVSIEADKINLGSQLESTKATLQKVQTETHFIHENLVASHRQEIQSLKELNELEIAKLVRKYQGEHEELEKQQTEMNGSLRCNLRKITDDYNNNKNLLDQYSKENADLSSGLKKLREEVTEKTFELHKCRNDVNELRTAKESLEKCLQTTSVTLERCQEQLLEKESLLKSVNGSLQQEKAQHLILEDNFKKSRENNLRQEASLIAATQEINKGNDIITKLQSIIRTMKTKIKEKSSEVSNAAATIASLHSEADKNGKKQQQIEAALLRSEETLKAVQKELESCLVQKKQLESTTALLYEANGRLDAELRNKTPYSTVPNERYVMSQPNNFVNYNLSSAIPAARQFIPSGNTQPTEVKNGSAALSTFASLPSFAIPN